MITENEIIFEKAFNEEEIKKLLVDNFFPEDFTPAEKELDISGFNFEKIKEVKYAGRSENLQIHFLVIKHTGTNDPRVTITRETFKIVKNYRFKNTIAIYFTDDSPNYRISLITMDIVQKTEKRVTEELSNPKRYSYFLGPDAKIHTPTKNLILKGRVKSEEDLRERFNIEVVTDEFFEAYKYALKEVIIKSLKHPEISSIEYKYKHSFAQQLLSRIMFVYFLQKKSWFKWKDYTQDLNYIRNFWFKYKNWKEEKKYKDVFYSKWLKSLFFGAFNRRPDLFDENLPEDIKESFSLMPYLNGGLFSPNELDELNFELPDSVFEWLFEPDNSDLKKGFLETFNFTIDESLPVDVEVAVDPEMLGKVYESLIAEEERGESGIFYTPRVEIDFMCRMSLIEYLSNETQIQKDKIIDFVFDSHNKISIFSKEELKNIKEKLDKVKVVDPAVGSASFLVGMMNILVELHQELKKVLENKEENLFALKQKIILENLYGVDVKDWAVMVGELRLWLSLIIETDEKYMDIYTKPLLPNLSFKIRQGDSLIQEIAGIQINLRKDMLNIPKETRDKITELIERKTSFFSGLRSADLKELKEIEKFEQEIFKEIINKKISELKEIEKKLSNDLKSFKKGRIPEGYKIQVGLFEEENNVVNKEIKKHINELEKNLIFIKQEIEKNKKILSSIKNKTQKDYFLWELDFIEVFSQKKGFDIVIGNPPYVRQELIAPPLEDKNNYSDDNWREIKKEYKEKLIQSATNTWDNHLKIDKKSDLYVYFYYKGLYILRSGGVFCFINSNSWLDVGYGAGLQEFLLKNMKPVYIFDNIAKRSFSHADVNTVIVLIQKPDKKLDDYTVKFVAFKKPFEYIVNNEIIKKIESSNTPVFDDENFRIYPKTKKELLIEGVEIPEEDEIVKPDPEHLKYTGNKWGGKYLRAPEIYFKILEKGKGKLVRLRDIAEVRRGFTTGANEFFYLKPVDKTVKEVVKIAEKNSNALIRVKNSAGWEGEIESKFLKPVIKSPRELKTIIVRLEDLNYLVFMCNEPKSKLSGTKVLEYIKWGEKQEYHKYPTMSGREIWYFLPSKESKILFLRATSDRPAFYYSDIEIYHDQTFYSVIPKKEYQLLGLLLNNSFSIYISREINSGASSALGLGASWTAVYETNNIELPFIKGIENFKKIQFGKRKPDSIFTELGFDKNKPIREQEPKPLPDRKALDDIIFDALGLTEEERKEVYWAVAELVKARLDKARSV